MRKYLAKLHCKNLMKEGKSLDNVLQQACAVFREATLRALGIKCGDVQVQGALALIMTSYLRRVPVKIRPSRLAAYLRALEGKDFHVVTVHDYFAKKDAGSMGGKIFNFLQI